MNFANQYAFDRKAEQDFVTQHLAQLVAATEQLEATHDPAAAQRLTMAYQQLLTREQPLVAAEVLSLNQLICEGTPGAGQWRTVAVTGTADGWVPPVLTPDRSQRDLTKILTTQKSVTEKAMEVMLYLSRWQPLATGNQRTAWVAANALMMAAGAGILAIPVDQRDWYLAQLREYQQAGRGLVLKQWLYRNAVWGTPANRVVAAPQRFHQNKYSPLNGPQTGDWGE